MSPRRIGLLGGTFDPVHEGHLELAKQLIDKAELDEIQWIPSRMPPQKRTKASAEDRLAMLQLALKDEPRFVINTTELFRPGLSYTIDTVKVLRAQHPNDQLFLILGADLLPQFHTWLHAETILKYVDLIVVSRPGYKKQTLTGLPKANLLYFELNTPALSSSAIRAAISKREKVFGLPAAVFKYIQRINLY